MATIRCRYCGIQTTSLAGRCPACGASLLRKKNPVYRRLSVLLLVALAGAGVFHYAPFPFERMSFASLVVFPGSKASGSSVASSRAAADAYAQQVEREIGAMHQLDWVGFRDDAAMIEIGLSIFEDWARLARRSAEFDLSREQAAVVERFRMAAREIQRREFPMLRHAYGRAMRQALGAEGVEVQIFGSNVTTIEFAAAAFSDEAYTRGFLVALYEDLKRLRFVEAHYRWSAGERGYTRSDTKAPGDGDLVYWEESAYRVVH